VTDRLTYTAKEAAAALGIGRDSVYRAINSGEIPAVRVGNRRLVPVAWLEKKVADAMCEVAS